MNITNEGVKKVAMAVAAYLLLAPTLSISGQFMAFKIFSAFGVI